MELYVCWGTFSMPGGVHSCRNAHQALLDAGWNPEVKKTYGLGPLPKLFNPGRAEVRELSGQQLVPVLVTDDGEVVNDSKRIIEWARVHPAPGAGSGSGPASTSSG